MQRWWITVGVLGLALGLVGVSCGGGRAAHYGGYAGGSMEAASEAESGGYGGDGYAAPAAVDRSAHVITPSPVPGSTTVIVQGTQPQHTVIESVQPPPRAGLLTAASVGDCDRRDAYLEYVSRHSGERARSAIDLTRRIRFRVVDDQGRPVNAARIVVADAITVLTHADGIWDFHPSFSLPRSGPVGVVVDSGQAQVQLSVDLPAQGDGPDVTVRLAGMNAIAP